MTSFPTPSKRLSLKQRFITIFFLNRQQWWSYPTSLEYHGTSPQPKLRQGSAHNGWKTSRSKSRSWKFNQSNEAFLEKEKKALVFAKHGKGETYPRGNQRQGWIWLRPYINEKLRKSSRLDFKVFAVLTQIAVKPDCGNQKPIKVTDIAASAKSHPTVWQNKLLWARTMLQKVISRMSLLFGSVLDIILTSPALLADPGTPLPGTVKMND